MHAAEGVIEAIGSLTLLSNETLSETDIAKKFQDGTSKALRAYVVANKETVEILTGLVKETGHRFFELLPRRIQLIEAYTDHSIPLVELQGKANRLISSLRQDVGVDKPGDWSYVEYARLDVDDIKQAYRDGMKRIDVEVQ